MCTKLELLLQILDFILGHNIIHYVDRYAMLFFNLITTRQIILYGSGLLYDSQWTSYMDSCWIIHLPGVLNSGNMHNRNVDVFGGFVTNNYLQWLPTLILHYDQSMIMAAADYKYII